MEDWLGTVHHCTMHYPPVSQPLHPQQHSSRINPPHLLDTQSPQCAVHVHPLHHFWRQTHQRRSVSRAVSRFHEGQRTRPCTDHLKVLTQVRKLTFFLCSYITRLLAQSALITIFPHHTMQFHTWISLRIYSWINSFAIFRGGGSYRERYIYIHLSCMELTKNRLYRRR